MVKEFDLFRTILIASIVGVCIALISSIDYSGAASWDEFVAMLNEPLALKKWHYALLLWFVFNGK